MKTHIKNPFTCLGGASTRSRVLPALLAGLGLLLPAFGASAGVVLTSLHSFQAFTNGAGPSGLVQGSDGSFYGTTSSGGTNNSGTVFKISANGALTSLYSFTGGNDGGSPQAALVQGSDGSFYGTTVWGGTNGGDGTVFKVSTSGALTSLYSFTGGMDGAYPAGLVQRSDGSFYGTTVRGGTNGGDCTVFKVSTNGALTSLYSFTSSDGGYPQAGLILSGNTLYGTASKRGIWNAGTVFAINTDGTGFTSLHSFTALNNQTNSDGAYPQAGLILSGNTLYGTAALGGNSGAGTVFAINTDGTGFTNLYNFTGGVN